MQKILIILAASLSLVSIGLGYVNLTHLKQEKSLRAITETDRDAARKKMAEESTELKATQEKLTTVSQETEKSQSELVDLQSRFDKLSTDQADLQKQIAEKDTDLTQQKTDLTAKDARITELETKGSTTSTEAPQQDEIKEQLKEKDILTAGLQAKLKENEAQLSELRKKEVDRKAKIMRTGLEGRVLAVNPSWNFVVISLGDRNGVINNAELLISRSGQLIGKIRVTSVEPSTSVADIVANSVTGGLSVQPGDTVVYKGPEGGSENDSESKL